MNKTILMAVLLAGCASAPNRIPPAPTPVGLYRGWTCEELVAERDRINSQLGPMAERQRRAAVFDTNMTILGFVAWPLWIGPLASHDYGYELSQLKGTGEAVNQSIIAECHAP